MTHHLKWTIPILLFYTHLVCAEELTLEKFDGDFALIFSWKHNTIVFAGEELRENALVSNRPLDFGFGIRYQDLAFTLFVSSPISFEGTDAKKSTSFDGQLTWYQQDQWYYDSFFKYYSGFHPSAAKNDLVDLEIMSAGIFFEYSTNHKNHSLRSAYNLDRRQRQSSGSFMLGFDTLFQSILSQDEGMSQYGERRYALYAGPNFGYSYTVVWYDFFVNAMGLIGINGGYALNGDALFFTPLVWPKIAVGYHGKSWSINMVLECNTLFTGLIGGDRELVFQGTVGMKFSKRL
jgi:hypothetical protein